jgi:translation initiation factor 1 (eIF-1/SUI1)
MKSSIVLLLTSNLLAYTIQLGAFKDSQNIKNIKKEFKHFNIYVKQLSNGISIVYITNIDKQHLSSTLQEINKKFPSAFIVRENRVQIQNNLKNRPPLNSKSIIKTRKKFFQ